MKTNILLSIALLLVDTVAGTSALQKKNTQAKAPSPLDVYVHDAAQQEQEQPATTGSLWTPLSQFADLGRDLKASQVNDIVTIVVSEQASAVSSGASQSSRTSSLAASITGLVGIKSPAGALANLANTSGATSLKGDGTSSRQTTLTTTVSARVTRSGRLQERADQFRIPGDHGAWRRAARRPGSR